MRRTICCRRRIELNYVAHNIDVVQTHAGGWRTILFTARGSAGSVHEANKNKKRKKLRKQLRQLLACQRNVRQLSATLGNSCAIACHTRDTRVSERQNREHQNRRAFALITLLND